MEVNSISHLHLLINSSLHKNHLCKEVKLFILIKDLVNKHILIYIVPFIKYIRQIVGKIV